MQKEAIGEEPPLPLQRGSLKGEEVQAGSVLDRLMFLLYDTIDGDDIHAAVKKLEKKFSNIDQRLTRTPSEKEKG